MDRSNYSWTGLFSIDFLELLHILHILFIKTPLYKRISSFHSVAGR